MYKATIKCDGLNVVTVFANSKDEMLCEVGRYICEYMTEFDSKFNVTITKDKQND